MGHIRVEIKTLLFVCVCMVIPAVSFYWLSNIPKPHLLFIFFLTVGKRTTPLGNYFLWQSLELLVVYLVGNHILILLFLLFKNCNCI